MGVKILGLAGLRLPGGKPGQTERQPALLRLSAARQLCQGKWSGAGNLYSPPGFPAPPSPSRLSVEVLFYLGVIQPANHVLPDIQLRSDPQPRLTWNWWAYSLSVRKVRRPILYWIRRQRTL